MHVQYGRLGRSNGGSRTVWRDGPTPDTPCCPEVTPVGAVMHCLSCPVLTGARPCR